MELILYLLSLSCSFPYENFNFPINLKNLFVWALNLLTSAFMKAFEVVLFPLRTSTGFKVRREVNIFAGGRTIKKCKSLSKSDQIHFRIFKLSLSLKGNHSQVSRVHFTRITAQFRGSQFFSICLFVFSFWYSSLWVVKNKLAGSGTARF